MTPTRIAGILESLNWLASPMKTPNISASDIPSTGLAEFVAELARRRGLVDAQTPDSALARVITRLAGDEASPDKTERLIIALRRAKVIDGTTMLTIQGRYLDEKFHVRPVR